MTTSPVAISRLHRCSPSRSSRPAPDGSDLTLKRSRYESAGTASYWVVDPDELSLTAWDLVDGAYVEVAHVTGEEEWTATSPFPVTVSPAALRG